MASLRAWSIHSECALSIAERNGQNLVQSRFERRLRIVLAAEMLVVWKIGEVGVVWGIIPTRLELIRVGEPIIAVPQKLLSMPLFGNPKG